MTSLIILILRVCKATPDQRLQTLQRVILNTFVMAHRFSTNSRIWVFRPQGPRLSVGPSLLGAHCREPGPSDSQSPITAGSSEANDRQGVHDRPGPLTAGSSCALHNLHNR